MYMVELLLQLILFFLLLQSMKTQNAKESYNEGATVFFGYFVR